MAAHTSVWFPLEPVANLIVGSFGGNLGMWVLGFCPFGGCCLPPLALVFSSSPRPLPISLLSLPCSPGPEDIGPPIPEADELLNK